MTSFLLVGVLSSGVKVGDVAIFENTCTVILFLNFILILLHFTILTVILANVNNMFIYRRLLV